MSALPNQDTLLQARELAGIAEDVYRPISKPGQGWARLDRQAIEALGLRPDDFSAVLQSKGLKRYGLKVGLYETANKDIVVAFAGTTMTSVRDWITNLKQGLGLGTRDFDQATQLAEALTSLPRKTIMVGHSKGGALAALAGAITQSPVVTFNTAGLHTNTLKSAGIDHIKLKEHTAATLISNYANKGEILQKVNGLILVPKPLGPRYEIGDKALENKGAFRRHGMDLVIKSLDETIQDRAKSLEQAGKTILENWVRAKTGIEHFQAFRQSVGELSAAGHDLLGEGLGGAFYAKLKTDTALRVELGQASAAQRFSTHIASADASTRQNLVAEASRLETINPYAKQALDRLSSSSPDIAKALESQRLATRSSHDHLTKDMLLGVTDNAKFAPLSDKTLSLIALQDERVQNAIANVEHFLGKLYTDPAEARTRLVQSAQQAHVTPKAIATQFIENPAGFGRLKEGGTLGSPREVNAAKNKVRQMSGLLGASKSELIHNDMSLAKVVNTPIPSPSNDLRAAINKVVQTPKLKAGDYSLDLIKEAKTIYGGLNQSARQLSIKIGSQALIAGAPITRAQTIAANLQGTSGLKAIASLASPALKQTPKISR